jgi:hypothetical protein
MDWYNQNRPHSTLDGKTPDEIYHTLGPASECPRIEPRSRWPRTARCLFPQASVAGQCGVRIRLGSETLSSRCLEACGKVQCVGRCRHRCPLDPIAGWPIYGTSISPRSRSCSIFC